MKKFLNLRYKQERGITLIALVITIIIIFIISAISINGLSQSNIIEQAKTSENQYEIENYKEQLREKVEMTVRRYSVTGEELSISNIANELNSEEWIDSATANTDTTITNEDIIVVTNDGYVFQVYYNPTNGNRYVEYLGDNATSLIDVVATYNAANGEISVSTSEKCTIEIILKGSTVKTAQNTTSTTYTVENSGDYVIKVATDEKARYAWLRVSTEIETPTFEITSTGEEQNGWYGKDNEPVIVTVSGDTETTKGIYYKINSAENYTYVEENAINIQVNTVGKTTIYAYLVDNVDRESDVNSFSVKYDNVKPVLGEIIIQGEKNEEDVYTSSDVVLSIGNATDANSGIAGFYYWLETGEDNEPKYVEGTARTITIKSGGTKEICFRAIDRAGNMSEIKNVELDKLSPVIEAGQRAKYKSRYRVDEKTAIIPEGFTVSAKTGETSINNGLVIYRIPETGEDAMTDVEIKTINWNDEELTEELRTIYDQFVWIPIPREHINDMFMCQSEDGTKSCNITVRNGEAFCTTHNSTAMAGRLYGKSFSNINLDLDDQTYTENTGFREPDILDNSKYDTKISNEIYSNLNQIQTILGTQSNSSERYNTPETFKKTLQSEYNLIVKSVYENEGFWVGRYETSGLVNNNNEGNIKIVAGAGIENGTSIRNTSWYRMYAQQRKYVERIGFIGGMISGAAYDQLMAFVDTDDNFDINSTTQVDHTYSNVYSTGSKEEDKGKNIYDLAGNVNEWTLEAQMDNNRAIRGGRYNYDKSAGYRVYGGEPTIGNTTNGTRCTLYIK